MSESLELQEKQTVLIVDDTPDNISLLAALLKGKYKIKIATNGLKALQIAAQTPYPDLILLDVMMPELDGHETCRRLKSNPDTAQIPVIFLTAKSQVEDEEMGLNLGAVDYIAKPISPPIVFARVATQLNLKNAQQLLKDQQKHMALMVHERTREAVQMQEAAVLTLASIVESRNHESVQHVRRIQSFVAALARKLREKSSYASMDEAQIELLYQAAALHDLGMMAVPENILRKPGKLDADEFTQVKLHTRHGRDAIRAVEQQFGQDIPHLPQFLHYVSDIAYSHHEKWDGSGYPDSLAGLQIPLAARMTTIADVYDALISKRIYKPAYSHSQAIEILQAGRGTHFDPELLDAFCEIEGEIQEIGQRLRDWH